MKFLADLNISPQTVEILRDAGWDIIRSNEALPATASDRVILDFALSADRIVITYDLDFSGLIALSGHHKPSLVTLRLTNPDPAMVARRLKAIRPMLDEALEGGAAVTIDDGGVRIRSLPIRL